MDKLLKTLPLPSELQTYSFLGILPENGFIGKGHIPKPLGDLVASGLTL